MKSGPIDAGSGTALAALIPDPVASGAPWILMLEAIIP
jgi:hypothetical protein